MKALICQRITSNSVLRIPIISFFPAPAASAGESKRQIRSISLPLSTDHER